VITRQHFSASVVKNLPLVAGSDHAAQLVKLRTFMEMKAASLRKTVNYEQLGLLLVQLNWQLFFANCVHVDDYASRFTDMLLRAVADCTRYKPAYKRSRLPEHVVQLSQEESQLG
jgi:hypothetical protein